MDGGSGWGLPAAVDAGASSLYPVAVRGAVAGIARGVESLVGFDVIRSHRGVVDLQWDRAGDLDRSAVSPLYSPGVPPTGDGLYRTSVARAQRLVFALLG